MSKIKEELGKNGKISKPEQRAMDFLGQRFPSVLENENTSRSIEPADTGSPASYMVDKWEELRSRELNLLKEEAEASDQSRGVRDVPISGRRNWIPIGPAGVEKGQALTDPVVSGRVRGIVVAPGGKRLYVATANGGVWYSGNGGHSWESLMNGIDIFPTTLNSATRQSTSSLSCGAIALVPGTSQADDKLFVGTGEGNGAADAYFGIGVLVSHNGGLSWNREVADLSDPNTISLNGQGFCGLAVHPDDPEVVYGATTKGVYKREPAGPGIYVWKRVLIEPHGASSIAFGKNGVDIKLFVGLANKFVREFDGTNWSDLRDDFPIDRIGRISIAIHPQNIQVIYAMVTLVGFQANPTENNPQEGHLHGIYRYDSSIDQKWRKIGNAPLHIFGPDFTNAGQGYYDSVLAIAPDNVNRIYAGGSTVKSGSQWVAALFRLDLNVSATGQVMVTNPTETIGTDVHADVHVLTFTPDESEKLWVGCDGGVFFTDKAISGSGKIFISRNKGLQTLTMNYLGTHPTEEEVLFCGVQDNGGQRYAGEDIWLHSTGGDSGYYLANWHDPKNLIDTYNKSSGRKRSNGGNRSWWIDTFNPGNWEIKLSETPTGEKESVLFYAPLVQLSPEFGIGQNEGTREKLAGFLAFGTQRPWISTDFGSNWKPLRSLRPGDKQSFLDDRTHLNSHGDFKVTALFFQDASRLLVGLGLVGLRTVGLNPCKIFRYTDNSVNKDWSVIGPPVELSAGAPFPRTLVTDFEVRPGHPEQFFATIGGVIGNPNHVWFYDGATWHPKGSGANPLIDVHLNAIIAVDENHIFVGSDVGIWESLNAGDDWSPFSFGLPETAIIDLQLTKRDLPSGQQLILLRASTYGRGVYEYQLSPAPPPPAPGTSIDMELYLRDHYLDKGRYATRLNFPDPRDYSENITSTDSPDIKLSRPNEHGFYQYMRGYAITPGEYHLDLKDDHDDVPVPSEGIAITRVYVQIHNRSAFPAQRVQVMLLAHALPDDNLPVLPDGYGDAVRAGKIIDSDGWKTVDIQWAGGVHAAHPAIVTFDLSSEILPAHGDIGIFGGTNYLLVAILHHPHDAYSTNIRTLNPGNDGNLLLSEEKKIAVRRIKLRRSDPIPERIPGYVPLQGYVPIPESATYAGAPFDAMLANSFRSNDHIIHKVLAAGFAAPFGSRGNVADPPAPHAADLVFADQINIGAEVTLREATPLIWRARQKITLTAKINGKGKGAPRDSDGDFGGSGGGSSSHTGKKCTLPQTNPSIEIAAASVDNPGANIDPVWASRAWLSLQYSKGAGAGGQSGADLGGLGGGIVVLCAPIIEFAAGGQIDVSGEQGPANAGGGGGGLILLIAAEIIGLQADGATPNIFLSGGDSAGTGKSGGNGLILQKMIN